MNESPAGSRSADRTSDADLSGRDGIRSVKVPWGPDGVLELTLPAGIPVAATEVVRPDLAGALEDYPAALERALDGSRAVAAGWRTWCGPGRAWRSWSTTPRAGPRSARPCRSSCAGSTPRGCAAEDVTISVGVGRHHARRRRGDETAGRRRRSRPRYRCFSPPVDDLSAYVDLGTTSPRDPGPRLPAGGRGPTCAILIGSVLPHLQAGFGGGYKLIFPGRATEHARGPASPGPDRGRATPGGLLGGDAGGQPDAAGDPARRRAGSALASRSAT